jgi:dienelactone hydrolase
VRIPGDLAAAGPYRVASARIALRRTSTVEHVPRRIDPSAWSPANAPAGCRLPLILFSHGHYGRARDYAQLLRHLASVGFVVLAPHHPDRTVRDRAEAVERTDDMAYLLEHLTRVADRLTPGLARHIDAGRVGIAGHSFGGFTAADLAATNDRVRAAIAMAGGGVEEAGIIHAPVLAMAGAADRLVPLSFMRGFFTSLPSTTPHGLLVLAGAGHGAYGNGCRAVRTCAIVDTYVTAFFGAYLGGVRRAGALLDPQRPRDPRVSLQAVGMPPR